MLLNGFDFSGVGVWGSLVICCSVMCCVVVQEALIGVGCTTTGMHGQKGKKKRRGKREGTYYQQRVEALSQGSVATIVVVFAFADPDLRFCLSLLASPLTESKASSQWRADT